MRTNAQTKLLAAILANPRQVRFSGPRKPNGRVFVAGHRRGENAFSPCCASAMPGWTPAATLRLTG
jgi:hypothetical protein